jgi:cob(I)alamin adenosyltransferase
MSKLYTRHGDDGWTVLFDGTRVRKSDPRVEAYGTVDELNARMGVVLAALTPRPGGSEWRALAGRLTQIQGELFCVGAELATPPEAGNRTKAPAVAPEHVARLEAWIDEAAAATPALRNFILPGGDPVAAQLHVCRAVCRRAERTVVTLASAAPLSPLLIVYLNRLGDLLFAWSRLVNRLAGTPETTWASPSAP